MKIIVVGNGKIGLLLVRQLAREGHDIVVVDNDPDKLHYLQEKLDVAIIVGNGASADVLQEADVRNADLTLAVTNSDEVNLLTALVARKLGCKHTAARVRSQDYDREMNLLKTSFGLSFAVNPEKMAAREIFRLLQFPSFLARSSFANGRAELVEIIVPANGQLDGKRLDQVANILNRKALICTVERNGEVNVPSGSFVLQAEDKLSLTAATGDLSFILSRFGIKTQNIRKVMIVGGSMTAAYLAEYLLVQFIGSVIGFLLSIPCERYLSRLYFTMTAILPLKKVPVIEGLCIFAFLFIVTGIFVFLFTRKITKTSPVKAITNGKADVYFSGRMNAPITKKGLGISMGFRQITSAPKRYISIFIVSALLIFTVITVELMSEYISSRDALSAMGEPFLDIEFAPANNYDSYHVQDVENIIKKHATIKERVYKSHRYLSVNGENVLCIVRAYPDEFSSVYKGRDIKYDNEVVITEQIANLLDLEIGDTVTLPYRERYGQGNLLIVRRLKQLKRGSHGQIHGRPALYVRRRIG